MEFLNEATCSCVTIRTLTLSSQWNSGSMAVPSQEKLHMVLYKQGKIVIASIHDGGESGSK